MRAPKYDCIQTLQSAGISYEDATALRRISMTLHRWHELECGDSNDYASWCITRGKMYRGQEPAFEHDENGTPFEERHVHSENKARYTPIADREKGALKRLAAIMARYPGFVSYVQGDPRGASLYILRPGDVPTEKLYRQLPDGSMIRDVDAISACYTRGIAVYK